jgi:hypothetical protein
MNLKLALTTLFFSFSALAEVASIDDFKVRHYCPQVAKTTDITDIKAYLKTNRIFLKTEVDSEYQAQFLNEYQKFPNDLRLKMIEAGAVIHLIQGSGISEDPTWVSADKTFDGRSWAKVPGGGGVPWMKKNAPTRIVPNHLYDQHGSSNLFLHEHGHSLDSIAEEKTISSSAEWRVIATSEQTLKFLKVACGSYCTDNVNEGFAELFAYYHACAETKKDVETYLPDVVSFFKDLPATL